MDNKDNRDYFHSLCKDVVKRDRSIIFAAVLDSTGKIIVGHTDNSSRYETSDCCKSSNDNKMYSFTFYYGSLLPVITRIKHKNHCIEVRVGSNRLAALGLGNENEKNSYILVGFQGQK